jgi:hypothetical protein
VPANLLPGHFGFTAGSDKTTTNFVPLVSLPSILQFAK